MSDDLDMLEIARDKIQKQSARIREQRDLLDECERALAPFGVFADEFIFEGSDDTGDENNELWPVKTRDLWAVQSALKKLRGHD